MNVNKVILVGRVVRDPEQKALPSGTNLSVLSLVTNRIYTKDNAKKEETEFHNLIAFANVADVINKYVKKGMLLYVEGRITTRTWDDQTTGVKRSRTEIVVENVQLPPKSTTAQSDPSQKQEEPIDYPAEEVNPDDIPF